MLTHAHSHLRQERLLKLYAALLKCGQTIIRCTHKALLFEEICRDVVKLGGMKAAWIGMVDANDSRVWPQAHSGEGLNYLQTIQITQPATLAQAADPVELVIKENKSVWFQDVLNAPRLKPYHQLAREQGWHAAALLPLRVGGVPVGVLCIYASEVNAFDPLMCDLLDQLASNISYALDVFEKDDQRRQAEYDLQESEVRYNALFSSSCMPMIVLDPQTCGIVDANILALNFYGWDKATFIRMKSSDINVLTPEQIRHEMVLAVANKRSYFEFQHRLANGAVRDVEVFTSPVDFGGRTYLMSAIHDVSERKRLQSQMHQAQALTQRFIDHVPGIAFVKDSALRLMLVNQNLGTLLGVEPQTLIGKTAHDIFPPEFADKLTEMDRQVLTEGGHRTYPETFNNRHSEASLFVMEDDAGERFLGGITLDVTDSYRANERTRAMLRLNQLDDQLSESEFLNQGLESAQALTNSQIGFLHFVNEDQETLELVTWTVGALKGCTAAFESHYPVSQAGIWADCLRLGKPVMFNDYATYSAKNGLPPGHAPLTRLISVPVIEGSQARMLLGVGNKATEYDQHDVETLMLIGSALWRSVRRVRVERSLQMQVQELSALNQNLAATQLQLLQSEKMASIGQLAAGVAHEINNPIGFVKSNLGSLADYISKLLGVVQAYAQLEQQVGQSGVAAHMPALATVRQRKQEADLDYLLTDLPTLIAESREGVERVGKIVLDLKNFSRVGESAFEWHDLQGGLESTINVVWNELKYKADVVREYGDLPRVYCVGSQINQVLMNLLVNAAQSIHERGVITVRTGVHADQVWFEVQDTGCGIDPDKQTHIFEPFYTTKPKGQGTGLGLSIAMGIVKQHHGSLVLCSEPGRGSTFRLTLPVNGGRSPLASAGEARPLDEVL
jgi:PAS domain S-box-containing protein